MAEITPLEKFKKAVDLVKSKGLNFDVEIPASPDDVAALEMWAKHEMPPSYRSALEMLGIPMLGGLHINGIGKSGAFTEGGSGVWFQTRMAREEGLISKNMLLIAESGYGPMFALDFETTGTGGEPVVRIVGLSGFKEDSEIEAQSFGDFFLKEISEIVADS